VPAPKEEGIPGEESAPRSRSGFCPAESGAAPCLPQGNLQRVLAYSRQTPRDSLWCWFREGLRPPFVPLSIPLYGPFTPLPNHPEPSGTHTTLCLHIDSQGWLGTLRSRFVAWQGGIALEMGTGDSPEDMNAQGVERLTLENGLRLALDKKELFLVYQPQVDIVSGKIIGLEALLRWQHPTLGLVPPDKFIRIAENCGLIVPLGEWVLRTACSQARKWQDEGIPAVSVAVNVSAVQFRQEGFCQLIRKVLDETGLAPQHLELELTEGLLLANADVTFSVLQELTDMGLTLAIDDFGTGYSNFTYLRQFRVSKLKIDRSFIRDVAVNPDDASITTAIISMAKSLNIKVIAEGVEDEAQMSFLRAHQCDEIQGYYFSKPLAVDKVAEKMRGDSPQGRTQANGGQS
jgi:EAL domain-containing protein (putative c-di-GMP-specific phosphodiesterase class I)